MVAKINSGTSLYGAIIYNQNKVKEEKAHIIFGNRIISNWTDNPENVLQQILLSFENYLLNNRRTEKPIVHISLNPSLEDHLSDEQFASIAQDYMEKMGFGDQPYIVYKHEDIKRKHIHIISVRIDENGKKISDSYEHRRSMDVCRELEVKYGLKQITNKKQEQEHDNPYLKKVDFQKGDIKNQISNTLKTVFGSYKYQSFGEYTALLSCFNVGVKLVNGVYKGTPYHGMIYYATDDKGNLTNKPIKSSLFGKTFGYDNLGKKIKRNTDEFKKGKFSPLIKGIVAKAIKNSDSQESFVENLKSAGIDVVFRTNETGRIYGVTFIDHSNQHVYNGSRLGKEFSANIFNRLFHKKLPVDIPSFEHEPYSSSNSQKNDFSDSSSKDQSSTIEQAFGIFNIEPTGRDYEEEEFARQMQKRKKKKQKRSIQ